MCNNFDFTVIYKDKNKPKHTYRNIQYICFEKRKIYLRQFSSRVFYEDGSPRINHIYIDFKDVLKFVVK